MNYLRLFRMPTVMKITGRTSTITNAFVNSIIPVIYPTDAEVKDALTILGMVDGNLTCSYCGDESTEWDHLRPLVIDKKPTGYISEIHNLVPACGKCNQSKGNKNWHAWMHSDANLSPKSKGIADVIPRTNRLKQFENWGQAVRVDFEQVVGADRWAKHWENWQSIMDMMRNSQTNAEEIKQLVAASQNRA